MPGDVDPEVAARAVDFLLCGMDIEETASMVDLDYEAVSGIWNDYLRDREAIDETIESLFPTKRMTKRDISRVESVK